MSREQFVRSCRRTENAGNLIHVLLYRGKEWVAHCFGVITNLNENALEFSSKGQGKLIRIDLRSLVFDTDEPGFKPYRSWRLLDSDGWSWDVIDLESAEKPAMHK
jgi:hypothetical protein